MKNRNFIIPKLKKSIHIYLGMDQKFNKKDTLLRNKNGISEQFEEKNPALCFTKTSSFKLPKNRVLFNR